MLPTPLDQIIQAITGVVSPTTFIKGKLQRSEIVIKLLKQFNLDPEHPPSDFSGVYVYTVMIWSIVDNKCLKILRGHEGWVRCVTFSPDGRIIASGSEDKTIKIWDVNTGNILKTLQGHTNWLGFVSFSPDGKQIASGSYDKVLKLWNIDTGECIKTLQGHTNRICSVNYSPDGKILVSGSHDGTIKLWDVATGECLKTLRNERPYENMNITNIKGLSDAQKSTLKALGAIDISENTQALTMTTL